MSTKFFTAAAALTLAAASIQAATPKQVLCEAIDIAESALWHSAEFFTQDSIMNFEFQFTYSLCDDANLINLWDENPATTSRFHAGDFISFHMNMMDSWNGIFYLHMEGADTRQDLYDVTYETYDGTHRCNHSADGSFYTPAFASDDRIVVTFNEDCEFAELYPALRGNEVNLYYDLDTKFDKTYLYELQYYLNRARGVAFNGKSTRQNYLDALDGMFKMFNPYLASLQEYMPEMTFDYLSEIDPEEEPAQEEPQQMGRVMPGPGDENPIGIGNIRADGPARIYNLYGRPITNPTRGIAIINGKKIRL